MDNRRMVGIAGIWPDPSDPRKRQSAVEHLHAGVVGADYFGLKQNLLG
jgi:hypothetical protein